MMLTAEDYAAVIGQRIGAERVAIAARWLTRLREMLTVAANEVFPSEEPLDHIPSLVDEIARYLAAPADEAIAANSGVMDKARELGLLRTGSGRPRTSCCTSTKSLARFSKRSWSRKPSVLGCSRDRRVFRRPAPAHRLGPRPDAHHHRHLHQRVPTTSQDQTERIRAFTAPPATSCARRSARCSFPERCSRSRSSARIRSGSPRWRRRSARPPSACRGLSRTCSAWRASPTSRTRRASNRWT